VGTLAFQHPIPPRGRNTATLFPEGIFNLREQVYTPVMKVLFDMKNPYFDVPDLPKQHVSVSFSEPLFPGEIGTAENSL